MNLHTSNDAALLAAACNGDAVAFGALYERYAERIRRYHLRRTDDDEVAYDLLAETFAAAWCARGSFRDQAGGSIGPWLFGIARNVLLRSVETQRLEARARERLGMLEQGERPVVAPEDSWLDGADELLEALPPEQREAVELRVIEDLAYEGVARRLSIAPGTARVRVHRALQAMRHRNLMSGELR
jgi:RNA polymerase sigma-70 factor (ECF subfamily)